MFKQFVPVLLATFVTVGAAHANDDFGANFDGDFSQATIYRGHRGGGWEGGDRRDHRGRRDRGDVGRGFQVRWVSNIGWSTGWTVSDSPACGHGDGCACGGDNYCGQYQSGQSALYWFAGCGEQPMTITCQVR